MLKEKTIPEQRLRPCKPQSHARGVLTAQDNCSVPQPRFPELGWLVLCFTDPKSF